VTETPHRPFRDRRRWLIEDLIGEAALHLETVLHAIPLAPPLRIDLRPRTAQPAMPAHDGDATGGVSGALQEMTGKPSQSSGAPIVSPMIDSGDRDDLRGTDT
jgi:hypothetical protein